MDESLYSDRALLRRESTRYDPRVIAALRALWCAAAPPRVPAPARCSPIRAGSSPTTIGTACSIRTSTSCSSARCGPGLAAGRGKHPPGTPRYATRPHAHTLLVPLSGVEAGHRGLRALARVDAHSGRGLARRRRRSVRSAASESDHRRSTQRAVRHLVRSRGRRRRATTPRTAASPRVTRPRPPAAGAARRDAHCRADRRTRCRRPAPGGCARHVPLRAQDGHCRPARRARVRRYGRQCGRREPVSCAPARTARPHPVWRWAHCPSSGAPPRPDRAARRLDAPAPTRAASHASLASTASEEFVRTVLGGGGAYGAVDYSDNGVARALGRRDFFRSLFQVRSWPPLQPHPACRRRAVVTLAALLLLPYGAAHSSLTSGRTRWTWRSTCRSWA